jgi:hypothetical protein
MKFKTHGKEKESSLKTVSKKLRSKKALKQKNSWKKFAALHDFPEVHFSNMY